jgi:hypothetical protein
VHDIDLKHSHGWRFSGRFLLKIPPCYIVNMHTRAIPQNIREISTIFTEGGESLIVFINVIVSQEFDSTRERNHCLHFGFFQWIIPDISHVRVKYIIVSLFDM